jgi:uncharacterized membrane protein
MTKLTGTTLVLMGSGLLLLALLIDLEPVYQGVLLAASIVMNIWGIVKNIRERRNNQL